MSSLLTFDRVRVGHALLDVSLEVERASIIAVIGANGAGKSTLLRAAMGLVALDSGAIRLDGTDLDGLAPEDRAARGLGYVPEGRRVFAGLTTHENLQVACRADRATRARRLAAVTALFPDLAAKADERAWRLSGGQQQMLAIGRALMGGPRVLLLDEPALGLAPRIIDDLAAKLVAIRAEGTAIVLAEQNAALAHDIAERVIALRSGRLVAAPEAGALSGLYGLAAERDT